MLASAKSVHKIEAIQKRALRFMINNYESSYEDLLKRSGKPSLNLRRTWTICIEIYKTINNRTHRQQYKLNLEIPKSKQVSFDTKSLRIQVPGVWNALAFHIKSKKKIFRLLKK